jgi:hypothetical protein
MVLFFLTRQPFSIHVVSQSFSFKRKYAPLALIKKSSDQPVEFLCFVLEGRFFLSCNSIELQKRSSFRRQLIILVGFSLKIKHAKCFVGCCYVSDAICPMNILNGMIIEINKTKIANARQTCASAI